MRELEKYLDPNVLEDDDFKINWKAVDEIQNVKIAKIETKYQRES